MPGRLVLLGHPVSHSLSPTFQNAALEAAGIPLRYEAVDVPPPLGAALKDDLRSHRTAGNVTVPHKRDFAALCDRRTVVADRVEAVNTFWIDDDDALVGDNTDVAGVDEAARTLLGEIAPGIRVSLIGAGGSASAVLAAAEHWPGARVRIWNRSAVNARSLAARFERVATAVDTMEEALDGASLVVNATPIGMLEDAMPVEPNLLPPGAAALDLVYRRGETVWVRALRERGHRAADGLTMLVAQGAAAFERWFGVTPDRDVMWAAIRDP